MNKKTLEQSAQKLAYKTVMVDGVSVRYATRLGDSDCRWLVFLNGRSEWIEKYAFLPDALDLEGMGFHFLTLDHLGQGASGGLQASISDYDQYATAVQKVFEEEGISRPYMLTHSMGGLIALTGLLGRFFEVERLVLSSPLTAFPNRPLPSPWAKKVARWLHQFGLKNQHIGGHSRASFESNVLTQDPLFHEINTSTPYPLPGPTVDWISATFEALDKIGDEENMKLLLQYPILNLISAEEKVVSRSGQIKWAERMDAIGKGKFVWEVIPDARHELLVEKESIRVPVLQKIKDFLAEPN